MTYSFTVVDAFTDVPFRGNPAAVCILDAPGDEAWMRNVAAEMNLSETAFLHPETDGYRLRWLTPTVEVDLCGHATLASAHVLWETGKLTAEQPARFHTRSGTLHARRSDGWITLDFPVHLAEACEAPSGIERALGTTPRWVGRSAFDYVVLLGSEHEVRALEPNHSLLSAMPVRGVMVTAPADDAALDFVSRFFAPGSGIPEDPVTGSAHCALGPFWAERLRKSELRAYQASPRGGTLHLRLRNERIDISGQAVSVSRGEILGPRHSSGSAKTLKQGSHS